MDLFFIDYKGEKIEVSPAPDGKPDTYIVHLTAGDKTIEPYELKDKKGWRFANQEPTREAQEIGELIENSFIIRMKDSDLKTLDEYFNGKSKPGNE